MSERERRRSGGGARAETQAPPTYTTYANPIVCMSECELAYSQRQHDNTYNSTFPRSSQTRIDRTPYGTGNSVTTCTGLLKPFGETSMLQLKLVRLSGEPLKPCGRSIPRTAQIDPKPNRDQRSNAYHVKEVVHVLIV